MDSRLSQNDGSLNNKISEDGSDEFLNLIEDEDARPDDIIFEQDDVRNKKKLINLSLETLDERELQIIKNRHLSDAPKTLEVLGENLHISKERVRQIEKNAMIKMKSYINNQSEIKLLP